MNKLHFTSIAILLLLSTSCKSKSQIAKEQSIQESIETMRTEQKATVPSYKMETLNPTVENDNADDIIGVYEVKNDYYMAVYEIEKYKGKYVGKVHYYNDGETEYEGQGKEKDYFLSEVTYTDGRYTGGKMYLPDGSYYEVIFLLKGNNLEARMTVQGQPYTETWKRKKL